VDTRRRLTRRGALAVSAGTVVALSLGRAGAQRAVGSGGIAGGGVAKAPDGGAEFSLFASRLPIEGQAELVVFGRVQWVDPDRGLTLESMAVTEYGPVPDQENARELRGTMRVEGGAAPFVLRVVDGGGPTSGLDRITLTVGEAAGTPTAGTPTGGFAYSMDAEIAAGDVQLLSFDPATEQ
jgi:hypothetical protein